ncbi:MULTISPECIES: hypothetical protein [unclassified Acidovorax]|uniref:hypothetical protein n=1 Tax=unclassified Acidovorax TaxID=2684926 RepID=UPI00145E8A7A|nr:MULTISPECIES: hypothetical protein [unclassified Acidovorax]
MRDTIVVVGSVVVSHRVDAPGSMHLGAPIVLFAVRRPYSPPSFMVGSGMGKGSARLAPA